MTGLIAANGNNWVPYVIFLIVIGFIKVISAVIKAAKDAAQDSSTSTGDRDTGSLWEPTVKPARRVPPPVPAQPDTARAVRSQMKPPTVPSVTVPQGVSAEAAQSIYALETSDDSFQLKQERAYDLEHSDIPETDDEVYGVKKAGASVRKKYVKVNLRGNNLRNAIIVREIMAPPRCFDI